MGLNEQKICKDFDFVSRAENLKVFQLLEQLVDKPEAKQNAQLLDWVIHVNYSYSYFIVLLVRFEPIKYFVL